MADKKIPCDKCRLMFKKRKKEPPCDTCLPNVLPENREVFNVYLYVKDQVVVSGGRPVAIDYKSLDIAMDFLDVTDRQMTFQRVIQLWHKIHSENLMMEKVRQTVKG